MSDLIFQQLPYHENSDIFYNVLLSYPWPVYLDSGMPQTQERFDIISAKPYATLCHYVHTGHSDVCVARQCYSSMAQPFALIQQLLNLTPRLSNDQIPPQCPFASGAIGYFAYDLVRSWYTLDNQITPDLPLADLTLGFYTWAIIVDHVQQSAYLLGRITEITDLAFFTQLLKKLRNPSRLPTPIIETCNAPTTTVSTDNYATAFARIMHHLEEGDCYQANLTQRFQTSVNNHAWDLYRRFRQLNPSPFSACLLLPEASILSYSPERFLSVHDRNVLAQPIKGTLPRGQDPTSDQQLARQLQQSEKDKAENLMIVDLLRNDLSKSCQAGTVKVDALWQVKPFSNVHHLVSTISGQLAPGNTMLDALQHCFPSGSITGAPKYRAMQIIESLELTRRNVYCGAIGYLDHRGNLDLNVAIRTLTLQQQQLYFYAGGGIVIDSVLAQEKQELMTKINWVYQGLGCSMPDS